MGLGTMNFGGRTDPAIAGCPPGRAVVPQYGSDGLAWVPWGPHGYRWQ